MIEQHRLEQAALHAVDLLDPTERLDFERELRMNPDLQRGLDDFHSMVAAVSRTAPQHEAPPLQLGKILAQPISVVHKPNLNGHANGNIIAMPVRNTRSVLPWAVAVACAILATWFASQSYVTQLELHQLQVKYLPNVNKNGSTQTANNTVLGAQDVVKSPTESKRPEGLVQHVRNTNSASREQFMIKDYERLEQEIQKMRHAQIAQNQPQDGVLQMKLVELKAPDAVHVKSPQAKQLLDKVTEAVSASLPKTTEEKAVPEPPAKTPEPATVKPPKVSTHGVGADQELEISGPVNLKALNLGPDQRVVYRDGFPVETYQELNDGVWWDEARNFVWRKRPDGSVVGQQPPANWTPEADTPPLRIPETTPKETPPAPPTSTNTTPAVNELPVDSYTFVDGPRGEGTIILQNLPQPTAGQVHALWSQDTMDAAPVFRGYFPDLPNGNGAVSFPLPPGTPPARFMVTTEVASPNVSPSLPSNHVILVGPK